MITVLINQNKQGLKRQCKIQMFDILIFKCRTMTLQTEKSVHVYLI